MNITKVGKLALAALGMVMTVGSTMINDKIKDQKMEETIAKKVAEALQNNSES